MSLAQLRGNGLVLLLLCPLALAPPAAPSAVLILDGEMAPDPRAALLALERDLNWLGVGRPRLGSLTCAEGSDAGAWHFYLGTSGGTSSQTSEGKISNYLGELSNEKQEL